MNKEHGRHCERNLWWFLLLQRCCSDSIAGPVTPRLDWPHRVHVLLHATRRGTGLWWCGWRSSTHLGAHGVASWSHRRLRLVRSLRRSNTRTHWHKQRHTDREAHRQRSTQTKTQTEAQPHTQPHTCVIHTKGERARTTHHVPRGHVAAARVARVPCRLSRPSRAAGLGAGHRVPWWAAWRVGPCAPAWSRTSSGHEACPDGSLRGLGRPSCSGAGSCGAWAGEGSAAAPCREPSSCGACAGGVPWAACASQPTPPAWVAVAQQQQQRRRRRTSWRQTWA